jgi:hypothetical protein
MRHREKQRWLRREPQHYGDGTEQEQKHAQGAAFSRCEAK